MIAAFIAAGAGLSWLTRAAAATLVPAAGAVPLSGYLSLICGLLMLVLAAFYPPRSHDYPKRGVRLWLRFGGAISGVIMLVNGLAVFFSGTA